MKKKRVFVWIATVFLMLTAVFVFAGCQGIISLDSVQVVSLTEKESYEIGDFSYDDYFLRLTYSDGSVVDVPLTEDLLSEYDRVLLMSPGTQTVTVKYENKTATFTVTMTRKQLADDRQAGVVAPFLSDLCETYDGKYHTLSVGGDVPEGAVVSYPDGNSFTDAGVYPVTAVIQADGYDTVTLSATLTIEKATYVFENFAVVADYGKDGNGKALTSFVYDGQPHGTTLVGTYPPELGAPTYKIVNTADRSGAYAEGNTAVDAGFYRVVATFEGDSKNYYVDNLSYTCNFEISKQPISYDVLSAIKFEDVTLDYDAKPHRIDIGNVTLPAGISVVYYEADGKTPFSMKKDVNEDGYTVICHFESDNPNLEIINDKRAILRIMKVNYVNVNELHIAFADENTYANYDGTAHEIKVFGLNKNVTVQKFVWHKSATEDVEVTSLTDVLVDLQNKETNYKITAYFNTPSDGNHNDIDPLDGELKILKASYNDPAYTFDSEEYDFCEDEVYTLAYEELNLPVGMTAVLTYRMPDSTETLTGLPSVSCQGYDKQNPKKNYGVGTYTATLTFVYNPDNYVDAPASIAPETRYLTVKERVFHADEVIGVDNVYTPYKEGQNALALCTFDEKLADWVHEYFAVAALRGSKEELTEAEDAGVYDYWFRFDYFNGTKIVTADSTKAELKIVGKLIRDEDYAVTYDAAEFTYDGTTNCLPTATLAANVQDKLTITCRYYFAPYTAAGDAPFTQKYGPDDDTKPEKSAALMTADAACLAASKSAGTHKFVYTISGKNYEPLTVSYTLTVRPQTVEISAGTLELSPAVPSVAYDGKSHVDLYEITKKPDGFDDKVECLVKYVDCDNKTVENKGVDAGTYTYALTLKAKENYTLSVAPGSSFEYSFTVTPLSVTATAADFPVKFEFIGANATEPAKQTLTYVGTENYNADSPEFSYAELYGTEVGVGTYSLPVYSLGENWFSNKSLTAYHEATADSVQNATFLNKAFSEDVTVIVLAPDGTKTEIKGLETGEAQAKALNVVSCGEYSLLLILNNGNLLFNGGRAMVITFTVKPLEVREPQYPTKDQKNNCISVTADATPKTEFAGFAANFSSKTTDKDVVKSFLGAPMLQYTTTADGYSVLANLFSNSNPMDKAQLIARGTTYLVCCDSQGNVMKNGSTAVFDFFENNKDYQTKKQAIQTALENGKFDPTDEGQFPKDELYKVNAKAVGGSGEYTEAGVYYLLIDLGENARLPYRKTAESTAVSVRRLVVRIEVKPYEVTAAKVATLKDQNGTAYPQGASRLYLTEADKVTYRYGDSAIAGVDRVTTPDSYKDATVYTYGATYNGGAFGLSLLSDLPGILKEKLEFKLTYAAYPFQDGGATLGTLYKNESNTYSYDNLQAQVQVLSSTDSAEKDGVTSVGLYYVMITVVGDDLVCEGKDRFVVTVKVDRQENPTVTYAEGGKTYDLSDTANSPFPLISVKWNANKAWDLSGEITSAVTEKIKALGVTKLEFDADYIQNMTVSEQQVNKLKVTFTFNTDAFGGMTLTGEYPCMEIAKITVNLSALDFSSFKDLTYEQATIDGNAITADIQAKIASQFVALGVSQTDANTMASRIFKTAGYQPQSVYVCATDSKKTYATISSGSGTNGNGYGDYTLSPVFFFGNNEDFYHYYDIIVGDTDTGVKFTMTMGHWCRADDSYKITIHVVNPSA